MQIDDITEDVPNSDEILASFTEGGDAVVGRAGSTPQLQPFCLTPAPERPLEAMHLAHERHNDIVTASRRGGQARHDIMDRADQPLEVSEETVQSSDMIDGAPSHDFREGGLLSIAEVG